MANAFPNPATELSTVLRNIGYPAPIVRYIHDSEGLTTLQEVCQIQRDLIEPMWKAMREREPPIRHTTLQISIFKTLHSYLRRMALSRTPVNPAAITSETLRQELDYDDVKHTKDGDKKIPFPAEGFKKDTGWLAFRSKFRNFLDSCPSSKKIVPLSYVIRPDTAPTNADLTDPMWTVLFDGSAYRDDNRIVYTYLVTLTQDGPGQNIVNGLANSKDGRAAFRLLDSTFTGGNYKVLLLNEGWSTLHLKKFMGHTNYPWSSYKCDMDEAFLKLQEAKVVLDDATKVYHLLNGIQVSFLNESVNQVRQTLATDYNQASIYLANAVLTATVRDGFQRNKPQRHISLVHFGRYSDEDWANLTDTEKQEVQRIRRERNGARSGRGGRNTGDIGGDRRGQNHKNHSGRSNKNHGRGRGGSSARGRVGGRGIVRQVQQVQFQPTPEIIEADPVKDEWDYDATELEEDLPLEPRMSTGSESPEKYRRIATILARKIGSVTSNETGRCELDSHADNCMLGRDATVLEVYEGQRFQVYGYKKDTPVERFLCKACVAYDDLQSGISYVLIFDQCFVDEDLAACLICPNQLRENGVIVDDVPIRYDLTSSHSIKVGNVIIPLSCKGYVSYFNVRKIAAEEFDTLEHVEMTGAIWDPHSDDHELMENTVSTSVVSSTFTYAVDPKVLAKRLFVTVETAEATLGATTILAAKVYNEPRFSSYGHRYRYLTRKHLRGRFFTDTFFASLESKEGFKAAQLFINEFRYLHVVLMKTKGEAHIALRNFFDNVGLPDVIVSDNSPEQGYALRGSQAWKQTMNEFGVRQRFTEAYRHWQNYAESGVKLVKFRCAKIMERNGVPSLLWDHTLEYVSNLSNRMVHRTPRLEGRTPYEWVHGITPDISAFIHFDFYDYVFYTIHPKPLFPEPKRNIGRWLGPSKAVMCDLVYKILTKSGNVIHTSAVEPLTLEEREKDSYKRLIKDFDQAVNEKLGLGMAEENILDMFDLEEGETSPEVVIDAESQVCIIRIHGSTKQEAAENEESIVSSDVASTDTEPGWELAKVTIPRGNSFRRGIVKRKKRDHNGDIIGTHDPNPILDTTIYEVEFEDGMREDVSANIIAQAIYEKADDNGFTEGLILDEILDHFVSRKLTKNKTTKGWFLLIRWKDGSESVVRLADIKESYPMEIAQYAKQHGLDREGAFWWVSKTLKLGARIISK